jgi:hypothetical protein
MQQVKKRLEITSCFVFNYKKSTIPEGEKKKYQSPMGEMMKLDAYPEVRFIQNGCL